MEDDSSSDDLPQVQIQSRSSEQQRGRKQKLIIFNLALVNFVSGINFAILAPFFPEEAAAKGVSTALVGLIFGEFELVIFLTAPIFGILLPRLGAKFLYISGIFLCGSCSLLFGFLAYCPPGTIFILMTLMVRGVMAVGTSMYITASFAIIASSFPDSVTTMFGLLETFSGIGMMLGPPVGGALYQVGGFLVPFVVLGVLLIIVVPITMYFLDFDSNRLPSQTGSILKLLVNPHIVLALIVLWGTSVTLGFIDPIMQPFLSKQFHLNQLLVGLVFVCGPAIYAVLSPITGHVCDKKDVTKHFMSASLLLIGLSVLLLNPSPLLNIGPPRLWITIIGCVLLGFGVGAAFSPATKDVVNECLYMGYQDNFGTFSLVSGLINSCMSLGFFSGPIISGVLTDKYTFAWSTTYAGLGLMGLGVIYILYTIIFMYFLGGRHREIPNDDVLEPSETDRLLSTI